MTTPLQSLSQFDRWLSRTILNKDSIRFLLRRKVALSSSELSQLSFDTHIEKVDMEQSSTKPIQVVAITGGKGGVGKTNVSVNLGLALTQLDRRVTLLDADLGLANVDVLLGLKPRYTLKDVLDAKCNMRDVLISGPQNMRVVPAASGLQEMVKLGPREHAGLISAFSSTYTPHALFPAVYTRSGTGYWLF